MSIQVWYNGNFFPKDQCPISPLSHGLHYGTGAFEGIRVYNGKIFKLAEHIERLFNSAKMLTFEIPFLGLHITDACKKLIEINNIKDGYIRPLIFLDDARMEIGNRVNATNVLIACWPRNDQYHSNLADKKSYSLTISSIMKIPPKSFPYNAKATGLYAINHLAKKDAIDKGYDDALMLDYKDMVAEATTSNFFMVKDNQLHTPTTECCLNGITRQTIIQIAKDHSIDVIERDISLEDLKTASEAFLCGTVSEITAISSINGHKYGDNPLTQKLYKHFYQLTQSIT
jgi:branched-chain amino acid aminotransferase